MNYTNFRLQQLDCPDFIQSFETAHPQIQWSTMQQRINQMLRQAFAAATPSPPQGIGANRQSRAMYGIDLMIDQDFQPVLLEVNFSPDITVS